MQGPREQLLARWKEALGSDLQLVVDFDSMDRSVRRAVPGRPPAPGRALAVRCVRSNADHLQVAHFASQVALIDGFLKHAVRARVSVNGRPC